MPDFKTAAYLLAFFRSESSILLLAPNIIGSETCFAISPCWNAGRTAHTIAEGGNPGKTGSKPARNSRDDASFL